MSINILELKELCESFCPLVGFVVGGVLVGVVEVSDGN